MSNDFSNDFTQFVRILARGRNASRDMTQEEAFEAMSLLLKGEVLPEQLGAFFMLMRVKEETPEELAGFAQACQPLWGDLKADLIWPSYAGKRRQPLWYALSIQLIKDAGYSVLIHGTHGHTEGRQYTADITTDLGIDTASTLAQAKELLNSSGAAYIPCDVLNSNFQNWLMTKQTLGLRSPMNTLLRLISPEGARGVQSVFHPNYGKTHKAACEIIGKKALIMKGEGGEFEINPERTTQALFSCNEQFSETVKIPSIQPHFDNKSTAPSLGDIKAHWLDESNEYGHHATLRTTAVVLMLLESLDFESAYKKALHLWSNRDKGLFNQS